MSDKPYWWPIPCDSDYYDRLRREYPEKSHWDDDDLGHHFNANGHKYENATLWDRTGDASEDYEALADAFLAMVAKHGWDDDE